VKPCHGIRRVCCLHTCTLPVTLSPGRVAISSSGTSATHTHTRTQICTHTRMHSHTHTHTHTIAHWQSHNHRHTHTQLQSQTHNHTHTQSDTHTLTQLLSHTHTHIQLTLYIRTGRNCQVEILAVLFYANTCTPLFFSLVTHTLILRYKYTQQLAWDTGRQAGAAVNWE
jgi:hypothetical protein